ncbi:hypothetical protein A2121_02000 [Candidatus Nomurabacteria bacterium GWB1_40_6]|uniref:Uncharacterized protein n=1 Tax=Candidatus Nomurabacteria bacterium GWB1_40_6 TaxID=1801727 RepID=A0A1F6TNK0_9BACT|nr:MAG: hypothetical protein A2121_02000 [Candidatus Nomurabacteria bacterium GWB1_40_6]
MKNNSWLYVILIFLLIWFWKDHRNLKNELVDMQGELYSCQYALGKANSNIEDAKWYAWESYDEMGDALDNLETVGP